MCNVILKKKLILPLTGSRIDGRMSDILVRADWFLEAAGRRR